MGIEKYKKNSQKLTLKIKTILLRGSEGGRVRGLDNSRENPS